MNRQQQVILVATLVVIRVWSLPPPTLAADCPELVGRLHGGHLPYSVAVSGGLAYLGNSFGLLIVDVSDPSAPQLVGDIGLAQGALGVAVSGHYAYVASGGLRVIDVSTPSRPVQVGSIDTPGYATDIAVSSGYAYLATDEGLRVIDVSSAVEPEEIGFVDTPPVYNVGIVVSGGYAYVAASEAGLRVIDVSTPSVPVEAGFVFTSGDAHGVAVSGGYAYVADSDAGLRVIDVSTPSAPVEVGFVDTPGWALDVAVSGSYAYVADSDAGLLVIDVSTSSAPVEVGSVDTPGWTEDVAVSGDHAYVTSDYLGAGSLHVIDVGEPSSPGDLGSVHTMGSARNVTVSSGSAYVGTWGRYYVGSLRVIDVDAPYAPVVMGSSHEIGEIADVAVADGYAYVAVYDHEFLVIDVSNPAAPDVVGGLSFDPGEETWGVAVSGNYAYLAWAERHTGLEGLRVIDVSAPSVPVEVGLIYTGGSFAADVAVSGGYAYVAGDFLTVIDVSTPSAPVAVGFVDTPTAWDVAVADGYAYLATDSSLRVINLSSPAEPVEVGFIDTPGSAVGVAASRGYAYVAWIDSSLYGEGGLRVIDVGVPSEPVEVGFYDTHGWESGDLFSGGRAKGAVAASDGYVYVASGEAGLYVFRDCAEGPPPDGRESFIPAAAAAAGAQGAFFQTDVEINNTGTEEAQVAFQWLPRGEDNSEPAESELIALAAGQSLRYENVLTELFGLGPDSLGALKLVASTETVIGMSRTCNIPAGETAGTFGQGLPAIRATEMIAGTDPQRIIFLSEDPDSRANVGCVNGSIEPVRINIGVFDDEGTFLETKTMDLGPYSNNQINRVFRDYQPVNGYVDVQAGSLDARYYCYGSVLDNSTSDPTTILPQVPSADTSSILAAALTTGLEGSFFQTDVDLNNAGSTNVTYELLWLPRGADNTEPTRSDPFSLAPGAGVRYANVLSGLFGLEPDQVGALAIEASGIDLLAMSRTYNLPSAKIAGTFGQGLPGIPSDQMIPTGVKKRIVFLSENDDVRSNVGCVNGAGIDVAVAIELYDSDGVKRETKYMMLPPYSNRQINGIFRDHAPVNGYVDVRTSTPDALIYCYGSVLDNLTSDPTTVLPQ